MRTVAIVGGGASGTLLASLLVTRSKATSVVIIDPCEHLGRGVAYATDCMHHTLNVPAGKISALTTDRDHFVRWLAANFGDTYDPSSFVPRSLYGDYLGDITSEARAAEPDRWRHVRASAREVREEHDGVYVTCSNGEVVEADRLVLATGNAAPAAWPNMSPEARHSRRYFGSTWEPGALAPTSAGETVVLLGTGLTAIDAVFGLRDNGHRGPTYMVSRRGLLPQEHRASNASAANVPAANTVSELFDAVRGLVRDAQRSGEDWRGVVDAMRPHTNALWKALPVREQRRFLRHALPYWNVHRHRMPPQASEDIADSIASKTLRVLAGRTGEITTNGDALRVPIKVRGSAETLTIEAGRLINCSGPEQNVRKLANAFVQSLLAQGLMVPNALGIGARVAEDGALARADGTASTRLFAIGPARFGTLIETTGMREIREQAQELAELLSAG